MGTLSFFNNIKFVKGLTGRFICMFVMLVFMESACVWGQTREVVKFFLLILPVCFCLRYTG